MEICHDVHISRSPEGQLILSTSRAKVTATTFDEAVQIGSDENEKKTVERLKQDLHKLVLQIKGFTDTVKAFEQKVEQDGLELKRAQDHLEKDTLRLRNAKKDLSAAQMVFQDKQDRLERALKILGGKTQTDSKTQANLKKLQAYK